MHSARFPDSQFGRQDNVAGTLIQRRPSFHLLIDKPKGSRADLFPGIGHRGPAKTLLSGIHIVVADDRHVVRDARAAFI
jgi:hypothetical protein